MTRSTNHTPGGIGGTPFARVLACALAGCAAWAGIAGVGAGETADNATVTVRDRAGGGARTITGAVLNDDFDKVVVNVRLTGGEARQNVPRPEVESVRYVVLGDTFDEASGAFERERDFSGCVRILRELEAEVRAARPRNPEQPLQHVYYLRARAYEAAGEAAADPNERTARYKDARKTLDDLFKMHKDTAWYFEARLMQQRALVALEPAAAAERWRAVVKDFNDRVDRAPWARRYVIGAQLDQWRADADLLLAAPGNEQRAEAMLGPLEALEKDPSWKEFATSAEQAQANRLRLGIYRYAKKTAELARELGHAIRQAQLDNNAADLTGYYLMRADSALALMRTSPADSAAAKENGARAFMDYLRVFTVYGEHLGDDAPLVAMRLAELYLQLKGPDWYERALEMADAARRAPKLRDEAERLLKRIQEQAPKEGAAAPASAGTPAPAAAKP